MTLILWVLGLQSVIFCSSVGSRISHVAKLRLQKHLQKTRVFRRIFSKFFLFSPTCFLDRISDTTKERARGLFVISKMGRIVFPLSMGRICLSRPFHILQVLFDLFSKSLRETSQKIFLCIFVYFLCSLV